MTHSVFEYKRYFMIGKDLGDESMISAQETKQRKSIINTTNSKILCRKNNKYVSPAQE